MRKQITSWLRLIRSLLPLEQASPVKNQRENAAYLAFDDTSTLLPILGQCTAWPFNFHQVCYLCFIFCFFSKNKILPWPT